MNKGDAKLLRVSPREANLKRKLRRHLWSLGFEKAEDGSLRVQGEGKDVVRALHRSQRDERLKANQAFLSERAEALLPYFALGSEIDPQMIAPSLERVHAGTWQGDLFRLAALTWSVPVSNGFGRRLRYLVWDGQNGKLIGLIAIGDPVFNLAVRDKLIGWSANERSSRLVNIMDAYVLGALPPYNSLLGGKLIASLLRTRELYDEFAEAYGGTTGLISGEAKKARLLAITTSSSMGRSSVYNRLKLDGTQYLKSIGYTGGWGHFHIPDRLFTELREYLREIGHTYADLHKFGEGPNWRLRTTRAALDSLGFREDMLHHGIRREVFLCQLASNSLSILKTGRGSPQLSNLLSAHDVAGLALERWIVPRAQRRPEFKRWTLGDLIELFGTQRATMRMVASKSGRRKGQIAGA
ncbi:Druantia anti-phage system protein DruA [Qipengyuania mesophila]|uniref:Druantia anti-phage system protein DruA n=1 Tax=Qipengyuania mesophila TaxID=2867246 RepID=UPI003518CD64